MQHSITIANISIQHDQEGRYCLNDLHRAAGEIPKHKPANFLRLDGTKALIAEIDQCSEVSSAYINVGGTSPGTFVCKELVYAYAMWISAAFHLQVIRAYDTARTPAQPVVPQSLSAALRLAADQAEQIEAQHAQLALAAPKVAFVERYVEATGLKGFREVCKLLKANEARFREFVTEKKILYKLGGAWTAYQQHLDAGRFEVRTGVADSEHAFSTTKFTAKGVDWIAGEWAKHQLRTEVAA